MISRNARILVVSRRSSPLDQRVESAPLLIGLCGKLYYLFPVFRLLEALCKKKALRRMIMRRPGLALLASGCALLVLPTAAPATPLSIAQRLQRAEDQLAIQQLVTADYSTALDMFDGDALAAMFTPDADFILLSPKFPPRVYKGREAIRKAFGSPPTGSPPPPELAGRTPPVSGKHFITNTRVSIQDGTAKAVSYYIEVARDAQDKLMSGSSGYYEDDLKYVGGRWLIARRIVRDADLPKKGVAPLSP